MSDSGARGLNRDRVRGPRSDDRPPGQGTASPDLDRPDDSYGNGVPMETTERFPQGLGNPAQNAGFPHSHS
jgi:hypothetical protein